MRKENKEYKYTNINYLYYIFLFYKMPFHYIK